MRRLVMHTMIAFAALAALGCNQRPLGGEVLVVVPKAESLHQVGQYSDAEKALVATTGQDGWLHYGPYVEFEPAALKAEFTLDAEGPPGATLGKVDINTTTVAVPETVVAAADLKAGNAQTVALDFEAKPGAKYEFRLRTTGAGTVKLRKIAILRR